MNPYTSTFLDVNTKARSTFLARPNRKDFNRKLIPALYVINYYGLTPRNYYFVSLVIL